MEVVLYDLSTLTYRWSDSTHRHLAAVTAEGEVLSVVDCAAGLDHREAAFRAADAALAGARLSRTSKRTGRRVRMPIGLYNPFSGQVAVGPAATGTVYGRGARLEVSHLGSMCQIDDGELTCGGVTLMALDADYRQARDAHVAHPA